MVKVGDAVEPTDSVARALLPGALQTIRLAEKLGVEAREAPTFFRFKAGDALSKGDVVAETKGLFGFFKSTVTSEYEGTVDSVSEVTGNVLLREPPIPVEINAFIQGKIVEVMPEEGAVIETRGAMVQGIFGVGGERQGVIRIAVTGPEHVLEADDILDDDHGKILVGGSGIAYDAIIRAQDVGVTGIVAGAIRDVDLTKYLGYDIGVAITGQEAIPLSIIATEGFGRLRMAERTFELLRSLNGHKASLNGATQIRAGVIRPEIIAPNPNAVGSLPPDAEGNILEIGTPIRIIREPYFGRLGAVTELPPKLLTVESGAEVRVLKANLDDGEEVVVPRANVEIIASK